MPNEENPNSWLGYLPEEREIDESFKLVLAFMACMLDLAYKQPDAIDRIVENIKKEMQDAE